MPASAPRRPRNRFRAETRFPARPRLARVAAILDVAPGVRRIVLGDAADVAEPDAGAFDDVVVLHFPGVDGRVHLPESDGRGELTSSATGVLQAREYTVRRRDPHTGELVVDFALHAGGLADDWVRSARVGHVLGVVGPRLSRALPTLPRVLAIGDATAIPALGRLLEEVPGDTELRVAILGDRVALGAAVPDAVRAAVSWIDPGGDPVAAVAAWLANERIAADTWAWIAGESALVGAARRALIDDHGLDRDRIQFTGYWKLNTAADA